MYSEKAPRRSKVAFMDKRKVQRMFQIPDWSGIQAIYFLELKSWKVSSPSRTHPLFSSSAGKSFSNPVILGWPMIFISSPPCLRFKVVPKNFWVITKDTFNRYHIHRSDLEDTSDHQNMFLFNTIFLLVLQHRYVGVSLSPFSEKFPLSSSWAWVEVSVEDAFWLQTGLITVWTRLRAHNLGRNFEPKQCSRP